MALEVAHIVADNLARTGMRRVKRDAAINSLDTPVCRFQVSVAPAVAGASHSRIRTLRSSPPIHKRCPIDAGFLAVGVTVTGKLPQLHIAQVAPVRIQVD